MILGWNAGTMNLLGAISNAAGTVAMMIDPEKNKKLAQGLKIAGGTMQQVSGAMPEAGAGKANTGTTGKPMPSNPPGQLPRPGVGPKSIKAAGESTHTGPPKGWNARQQAAKNKAEQERIRIASQSNKKMSSSSLMQINPNDDKIQFLSGGMA